MASVRYEAYLAWLIRQEAGARAERYGFVDAKNRMHVRPSYDPYEQMRYRQGYEDGRAMLRDLSLTVTPAMVVAIKDEMQRRTEGAQP